MKKDIVFTKCIFFWILYYLSKVLKGYYRLPSQIMNVEGI